MQVTIDQISRSGWSQDDNVGGNENIKAHRKPTHKLHELSFVTLNNSGQSVGDDETCHSLDKMKKRNSIS